jgi:XRE family transcriptional regulator, fatty acid utilization regulator
LSQKGQRYRPARPAWKSEGTPIGVNCRLCERENYSQRAEPPITRTLIPDENTRRVSSFAFSNARAL